MSIEWPATAAAQPIPTDATRLPDAGLLAEIAAGLATGSDLDALLQRFLDPIVRLAGAQAGAVRVLTQDDQQLQLVSAIGLPESVCCSEQAVSRHCGPCGNAADGQPSVWASDLGVCAARAGGEFFGDDCRRLLAVPMRHRGRVLGVYNLFFAGTDELAPGILTVLRSIGELLGLALNNARLEREHLRAMLAHERQLMAAELHDSLAQSLAFVKMRMPLLHDAMFAHDDARALQYYNDVRGAMTQAHSSLRGILTHFRAPMDPQGIVHALESVGENFRRSCATELEFSNALPDGLLAPELEAQVFHIVQEALTNVARHAAARHARLDIATSRAGTIEVVVEDDGAGLPAAAPGGTHYGLEIMLERARRLGGTLEVAARDGGGTRVRLAFPMPPAVAPRTSSAPAAAGELR